MVAKKYDVYHLRSAYNDADIQVDRDFDMNNVRSHLLDRAAELEYWDDWTDSQKKKYKEGKE
jgi:hypothetical protein